ncbi:MAG: hypothetical protein WD341_13230, partial [Tistlia sp.]|uniref:hypothetical protein n=1 Tax=Tistlia sp. TaxID=3057121 RepID=UPI0034A105D9
RPDVAVRLRPLKLRLRHRFSSILLSTAKIDVTRALGLSRRRRVTRPSQRRPAGRRPAALERVAGIEPA